MLKLTQISPHVWILPRHPNKNRVQATVGMVLAADQTILIDAGNSLQLARQIQATLAAMDTPPISHVVYTHHHWDHSFGACVYGVPVIAHRLSHQFLTQMQQENVGETFLRTKVERNPRLILDWTAEDWAEFNGPSRNHLRGVRLPALWRCIAGAGACGRRACRRFPPSSRLLRMASCLVGGLLYPAPRYENPTDQMLDMAMLTNLLDERYDTYIDGHNAPMETRHVRRILRSQALLARLGPETRPT